MMTPGADIKRFPQMMEARLILPGSGVRGGGRRTDGQRCRVYDPQGGELGKTSREKTTFKKKKWSFGDCWQEPQGVWDRGNKVSALSSPDSAPCWFSFLVFRLSVSFRFYLTLDVEIREAAGKLLHRTCPHWERENKRGRRSEKAVKERKTESVCPGQPGRETQMKACLFAAKQEREKWSLEAEEGLSLLFALFLCFRPDRPLQKRRICSWTGWRKRTTGAETNSIRDGRR